MTGDVVTRGELARTYGEDLVARIERVKGTPGRAGLAIGFHDAPPNQREPPAQPRRQQRSSS